MVASAPQLSGATAGLTAEQIALCEQLKKEVAALVNQHACLLSFCNEHTYVRYLRARSWNIQKALKMLMATLHWRLENKPHLIRWAEVEPESLTGKQHIYHVRDTGGRPIVLMRPRNENTKPSERQIKFLIYNLEMASRLADEEGVGKMNWTLDFEGYSLSNAPPIKTSIHCNSILQNHYPERLGLAVCWHSPYLFSLTWKAVSPFIDPVTKEKIKFIDKGAKEAEQMKEKFQMQHMEKCMGGEHPDFAFKLETYRTRALAFDAIVEAELEAFEAQLANPTSTSTASTHAVPAASAGPSPGPSSSSLPSSSATKHSAAAAEVASSAESQQAHTDSSLTACGSSPSGAMDGSAHAAQVGVESSALDASMQAQTPPMQKATGADAVEHLVPALEQVKVSASG